MSELLETPAGKIAQVIYPIHELLAQRWSPRSFADRPVQQQKLGSLLEAARWAASSYNEQPWSVLVATADQPHEHERLASCLNEFNRSWAGKAPVLMLLATKLDFDRTGEPNRHAFHDVGLALGNLAIQATAEGLSLHMLAGFFPERARELYAIPETHEPVVMLAIGYRGSADALPEALRQKEQASRTRKPLEEFVFTGHWGQAAPVSHPQH